MSIMRTAPRNTDQSTVPILPDSSLSSVGTSGKPHTIIHTQQQVFNRCNSDLINSPPVNFSYPLIVHYRLSSQIHPAYRIISIDTIDYVPRIGLIGVITDIPCFALAVFALSLFQPFSLSGRVCCRGR